ncbi:MAG: hypothetical protein MMC33_005779 [Icmadophila ericetorum]|nr:hypothetical protein [Icmadophila ericetorum]
MTSEPELAFPERRFRAVEHPQPSQSMTAVPPPLAASKQKDGTSRGGHEAVQARISKRDPHNERNREQALAHIGSWATSSVLSKTGNSLKSYNQLERWAREAPTDQPWNAVGYYDRQESRNNNIEGQIRKEEESYRPLGHWFEQDSKEEAWNSVASLNNPVAEEVKNRTG